MFDKRKGRNGHIPYRDSKLTRILQASLGGNARTAIICTLSPARSHVEQSRNTLLFASCAKEVVTSAQVNVVLSDKALVKHLQKELARLESELRYPRPTSCHSYTEALLKEKDAHIQKLEKEIKELNMQRDVAQSRILDLIKAVEYSQESRQWDGLSIHSGSHIPSVYDDELSMYDSSDVIDFAFLKSDASQGYACDSINYDKDYKEVLESSNRHNFASSINSVSGVTSSLLPGESTSILSQDGCQDMDDLCKEVRCIETDMTSSRQDEQPNALLSEDGNTLLPSSTYDNTHGSLEPITNHEGNKEMNFGKSIKQSPIPCPIFSSPWPPMQVLSSSRHLTSLPRSRSCRAILMNKSPSCWFLEEEQIANTPPSILFADFPGRREKPQRVLFSSNYSKENKVTLKDASQASEQVVLINMSSEEVKPEAEKESSGKCHSAAEWKDMSQIQSQEELIDGQVDEEKDKRDVNTKSAKDISLDPTVNRMESPSDRLEEFEIHQRKIIELWHSCNVSLIHRTYFFLLFKGDPADSIYMEVELRRLDFLKRVFMKENVDRSMVGHNVTLASSAKALRRERRMLCRYMQKRLSADERESIYLKWGIPLRSKQRKMQITRQIWSKSGDIDHVRESALVVAKLIGLLEPDKALKEMFALNFMPQRFSGRSPSWKHGTPYLV